jgi:hypothetical protein
MTLDEVGGMVGGMLAGVVFKLGGCGMGNEFVVRSAEYAVGKGAAMVFGNANGGAVAAAGAGAAATVGGGNMADAAG